MELNDLRQHWQQTDQLPRPLTDVPALVRQRSANVVEKMRRNVLLEASLTVLLVLAVSGVPMPPSQGVPQPLLVALRGLLLLLLLAMMYYYYQKLQLLRRMVQPEVQVREHLGALCTGLRQMLRFYYRLSLVTVPSSLTLLVGFQVGRELARKTTHQWEKLSLFAGALLLLGAVLQVAMVYSTRWYLQRLYGQHLDRLESQLHELDETAGPRSATGG